MKDGLLLEEEDSKDTAYVYEGDRLVSYGGADFVYDVMGNPTTYRGKAAKWEKGRNLVSYGGHTFAYDGQGRRIAKDGISFAYDSNGNLIKQSNGLEYIYDHSGVFGVTYGGETYAYRKDAQGNVIALMNASGAVVARYLYDAWGTCVVVNNGGTEISDANHIGNLKPFRYRGYYYDVETKLYYLKTRYYDPEVGRFMTIDGIEYLDPETINGLNLYAYCGNNPVMNVDPEGTWSWKKFWKIFAVVAVGIVAVAAVAAITALSGGSLTPIITGALIGAVVSGGISAGVQWATTGTVNGGQVLVDAVVGGVLGAFGGSAIGQVGMAIAGGLTSAAGSVAGDWMSGDKINYAKAAFSGALGALISFAGGAGAQNGELGARQAALATKKQILSRNAAGGYRHSINFAMKSNAMRIARVTKELNSEAIKSIIRSTVNMCELNVYVALVFAYVVGKYVSLESKIEKTKESYYETLEKSDMNWNSEENDITPFIKYMLETILAAYRDFEERVTLAEGKTSAIDLVRNAVNNTIGKFTKSDIMELVPSVGKTSVENSLKTLIGEGVIGREGKGKATFYFRKN